MENTSPSKLDILASKIVGPEELSRKVAGWKLRSNRVVFTNGVFDMLHPGHITCLAAAADQGNKLVVAINSDGSVKRLKGEQRPIFDQQSRALIVAAMQYVDAVCIFDEDTPLELIKLLQPDVLVKGGDYVAEQVVGYQEVTAHGGEVVIVPLAEGHSTTARLNQIVQAANK
ncbi:MAG TPA: D-glycero-beta-D-manno-heptose 1-phosphate adenylyltransferase [Edaphocola sp.]|nr:D-glycero-beta-D-manno-heptose 1-phosphate adenylyltransferase [Edaphocola sp.]